MDSDTIYFLSLVTSIPPNTVQFVLNHVLKGSVNQFVLVAFGDGSNQLYNLLAKSLRH